MGSSPSKCRRYRSTLPLELGSAEYTIAFPFGDRAGVVSKPALILNGESRQLSGASPALPALRHHHADAMVTPRATVNNTNRQRHGCPSGGTTAVWRNGSCDGIS